MMHRYATHDTFCIAAADWVRRVYRLHRNVRRDFDGPAPG